MSNETNQISDTDMQHALIKAYGFLWRYTPRNSVVSEARLKLKSQLSKDEQKEGIAFALKECGDVKTSEILTY